VSNFEGFEAAPLKTSPYQSAEVTLAICASLSGVGWPAGNTGQEWHGRKSNKELLH